MIAVPAGVRVLVATKPVDFRRGADSLAALVREQLAHDPFSGTVFIFRWLLLVSYRRKAERQRGPTSNRGQSTCHLIVHFILPRPVYS
jgi:hypothetical protein